MKSSVACILGVRKWKLSSELSRADPGLALNFPANAGIAFFVLAGLPVSQHVQYPMPCVFLMIKMVSLRNGNLQTNMTGHIYPLEEIEAGRLLGSLRWAVVNIMVCSSLTPSAAALPVLNSCFPLTVKV